MIFCTLYMTINFSEISMSLLTSNLITPFTGSSAVRCYTNFPSLCKQTRHRGLRNYGGPEWGATINQMRGQGHMRENPALLHPLRGQEQVSDPPLIPNMQYCRSGWLICLQLPAVLCSREEWSSSSETCLRQTRDWQTAPASSNPLDPTQLLLQLLLFQNYCSITIFTSFFILLL